MSLYNKDYSIIFFHVPLTSCLSHLFSILTTNVTFERKAFESMLRFLELHLKKRRAVVNIFKIKHF